MVEKRVKKFGQGSPPPLFGQCPKENIFFFRRASLRAEMEKTYHCYLTLGEKNEKLLNFDQEEDSQRPNLPVPLSHSHFSRMPPKNHSHLTQDVQKTFSHLAIIFFMALFWFRLQFPRQLLTCLPTSTISHLSILLVHWRQLDSMFPR